jgi:hypothetical protein
MNSSGNAGPRLILVGICGFLLRMNENPQASRKNGGSLRYERLAQ